MLLLLSFPNILFPLPDFCITFLYPSCSCLLITFILYLSSIPSPVICHSFFSFGFSVLTFPFSSFNRIGVLSYAHSFLPYFHCHPSFIPLPCTIFRRHAFPQLPLPPLLFLIWVLREVKRTKQRSLTIISVLRSS